MATRKKLKTFNVQYTLTNAIFTTEVRAETLEEAMAEARTYSIGELLNDGVEYCDWDGSITGIY